MLCDYCGKREANVMYSENINGQIKEMNLCEECSKRLGIMSKMDLNLSTNFSNIFGSLLEDFEQLESLPMFNELKQSVCDNCKTSFDDIVNSGRLGCANCYDVFSYRLDPILKRLQGANRHIGRILEDVNNSEKQKKINEEKITSAQNKKSNAKENEKILNLEEQLKIAIKEERYEDAAKIRDEIKKQNK